MKIGIIGAGVVGGATGRALEKKHNIMYYDKFKMGMQDIEPIAKEAEIAFICVPTPMGVHGEMDYSAIDHSLNYLYENIRNRNPQDLIAVIRSTAVSGTTDEFEKKYPFKFAFNPEFLREKHSDEDMKNTDRVVIGTNIPDVGDKLVEMYKEVFPEAKYYIVPTKTAEMIKYGANVMLASQIAVANELYNICKASNVDYDKVKEIMLHDKRIGRNIDVPGPDGDFGFGGKCFPKDLNALIYLAQSNHYQPHLLREIWRSNEAWRKNKDWLSIKGATTQLNFGI
ncbi:hypothetical protein KW787_01370 [Candidatus Pacearchaeota archaeon]|nr:hypothetical protein [Candidatus Pacearchaeota archaeon]